jgi:hypothetical protein
MYTNLVVVVNAGVFVDKSVNALCIISLLNSKLAGQSLYRDGMIVGQKQACGESGCFCTTHPVDIQ